MLEAEIVQVTIQGNGMAEVVSIKQEGLTTEFVTKYEQLIPASWTEESGE